MQQNPGQMSRRKFFGTISSATAGSALGVGLAAGTTASASDKPWKLKANVQRGFEPATERTPAIARYEKLRYGVFFHFGIISFLDQSFQDAKNGPLPPSRTYCPTDLDVDQWIATAKKAGMRYAVLSVKHHLGHALWDSKYTDYDVATSGCKTDVVAEFVKACGKHGVAPCFLYSLGQDVAHRRDRALNDDEWYTHANGQITELLTNYGPITTIWFDGMGGGHFPERRVREAYETVKSLQPDCLVVMHAHGAYDRRLKRWPTDVLQLFLTQPPPQGHNPWMKQNGKTYYIPMEVVAVLFKERDWFWRPRQKPLPVASLLKPYRDATSRGANLTLTAAPDRTGKLPADQVERLLQLAEAIEEGI